MRKKSLKFLGIVLRELANEEISTQNLYFRKNSENLAFEP